MVVTRWFAACALAAAIAVSGAQADEIDLEDAVVRGWLEHARLMPVNLLLDAKLDPGARTSSLRAEILRGPEPMDDPDEDSDEEVEEVEEDADGDDDADDDSDDGDDVEGDEEEVDESNVEDDEEVVEASVAARRRESIVFRVTNENGRSRTLEREIVRYVEIKMRGGGTARRPVVHLGFCVAGLWVEGDVNLSPREGFNYPLLIGRNMLAEADILVDSRATYTERSHCDPPGSDDDDEDDDD